MITAYSSLEVAKDAARRIGDTGQWVAAPFERKRSTPLGVQMFVGMAVFPASTRGSVVERVNGWDGTFPEGAIVMVSIEGSNINVLARTQAHLPVAQLVNRIIVDVASERVSIIADSVPVGPSGRRQPEQAWRAN